MYQKSEYMGKIFKKPNNCVAPILDETPRQSRYTGK